MDKNLMLELQYKTEGEWTECFDVPNVKIPSVAYLGLSAETGELADNHDIISVTTKNLYQPHGGSTPAGASKAGPGKSHKSHSKQSSGGGWGWFFFKFLLFGVAVAGAYIGFTAYRARSRSHRF